MRAKNSFLMRVHLTGTSYATLALASAVALMSCSGANNSKNSASSTATEDFTVKVTVTGLQGSGLALQDNGADNLSVTANGTFGFSEALPSGSTYKITVLTQPTKPSQTCAVTNGTGTIGNADVTNIQVACTTSTYSIGGTVAGYAGYTGLTLEDNGGPALAITANGAFTFPARIASGAAYDVTIATQPVASPGQPALTCTVANGSGTVGAANITNANVTCSASTGPPTGEWIWQGGSNTDDANGVYGTQGTAAAGNVPGARFGAMSFVDAASNLWLFGGYLWNGSQMNDLWEYSPATGLWTWQAGSQSPLSTGSYGTLGVAATSNEPPARQSGATWSYGDNFYLFGGESYSGDLSDLWTYSTTTGLWTWIAGSSTPDQPGAYQSGGGPGARYDASSWAPPSQLLWLFGGEGYDSQGSFGDLNDLWHYTSASGWVFVSGSTVVDQPGVYGTMGLASVANVPGARTGAVSWVDAKGNLWLFGGYGYDSQGNSGPLNDLWEFSVSTSEWAWMSGSALEGATGVYGTEGTPAATNVPGAREYAFAWVDTAGNLWLFGGLNYSDDFNDLWEYAPSTNEWTWMGGSSTQDAPGVYGTQGTPAAANTPGARDSGTTWIDSAGNFWLFGGDAEVEDYTAPFNDLWEYTAP